VSIFRYTYATLDVQFSKVGKTQKIINYTSKVLHHQGDDVSTDPEVLAPLNPLFNLEGEEPDRR
jgi:hypothetical protein